MAAWFWKENAYIVKSKAAAKKESLNILADGSFLNYAQLTFSLTNNLRNLQKRAIFNENVLKEFNEIPMKRGQGIECSLKNGEKGYAVPICLLSFKKTYCGCEGKYEIQSCPYGETSNGVCRNSAIIKCCVEKCFAHMDLVILMDSSGSVKKEGFKQEQEFVVELLKSFEIGINATRVSIINFNSKIEVVTDLKTGINKDNLIKDVQNIKFTGGNLFYIYLYFLKNYAIYYSYSNCRWDSNRRST